MLIDWNYKAGKLLVSYIDKKGKYRYKHLPYSSPKIWQVNADLPIRDDDDARTWDGHRCVQVPTRRPNKYSVLDYLSSLDPEEVDDILGYTTAPNIYFIDIETRSDDGFPEPSKAASEITLISIYSKGKVLVLGLRPLDSTQLEWMKKQSESYLATLGVSEIIINYECFETEFSMLKYFFEVVMTSINVISGWNISGFDWPYLVNRAARIGTRTTKIDTTKASPVGEYTRSNGFMVDTPKHKLFVDYMKLYEKWDTTVKVRESSSLNWVSNKLLGVQKVHYSGTLEQLLHENYPMYCFYNIIDCALVELIHQKQQYLNIMFAMAKLAGIRAIDSLSAINVTEGFLRKPLWDGRRIVFVKPEYSDDSDDDESIEGGYVKDPIPGLTSWLSVMDFNSLYPTTERTFTITPENYKGAYYMDENGDKWAVRADGRRSVIDDSDVITVNNQVFSQTLLSPTKVVLGEIYSSRKNYQKLKKESKEKMDEVTAKRRMLEEMLLKS